MIVAVLVMLAIVLVDSFKRQRERAGQWLRDERAVHGEGRLHALAKLVRGVADGSITVADAHSRWPFPPDDGGGIADQAWEALLHFDIDADIRGREADYDAEMQHRLRELAATLEGEG
jgi:hypothetical protein